MDQCWSRLKLSENFERHCKIHMDQSLVHTFSCGNSYGPMVLKLLKFPRALALVHGWLFPIFLGNLLPLETAELDREDHKEHLPELKFPKIIVSAAQLGN